MGLSGFARGAPSRMGVARDMRDLPFDRHRWGMVQPPPAYRPTVRSPVEKGEILVVEDNDENRDIFRTILEYGGFTVSVAEDGEEGLRAIRERRPDLVILDIGLPRMDGWELLRRLRAAGNGVRETPVMVVTADTSADGEERADRLGCVGFLTKPVEPRRLLAHVREVLSGPG